MYVNILLVRDCCYTLTLCNLYATKARDTRVTKGIFTVSETARENVEGGSRKGMACLGLLFGCLHPKTVNYKV